NVGPVWKARMLECRSRRIMLWSEKAAIDLVHLLVLAHVVQLDVTGNDVSEIHAGRTEDMADVVHGHACLLRDTGRLSVRLRVFVDLSGNVQRLGYEHSRTVRLTG